jgi:flagellin-specific chaperone FliS
MDLQKVDDFNYVGYKLLHFKRSLHCRERIDKIIDIINTLEERLNYVSNINI